MMMNLKDVNVVTVNDYSQYVNGKANNAGEYGFWETYTRIAGTETWERIYGCTAQGDMDFCPLCGQFADHTEDDDEEVQVISSEELGKLLEHVHEDEDHWVVFK